MATPPLSSPESHALAAALTLVTAARHSPSALEETAGTLLPSLAAGSPEENWDALTNILGTLGLLTGAALRELEHHGADVDAWLLELSLTLVPDD